MATEYELEHLRRKIEDDTRKLARLEDHLRLEERKKGDAERKLKEEVRRAQDEIQRTEDLLEKARNDLKVREKDGERDMRRIDDTITSLRNDIARAQEAMRAQTGQLSVLQKVLERSVHDARGHDAKRY